MRVSLLHIRKSFNGLPALADVSLTLAPGRVHGLLGENGAGKSTLMNVLYGVLRPDAGQILVDDRPQTFRSPHDALAAGIGMVHQHFMLAGAMTVLDNVLLGDRRARQFLDRPAAARRLGELSDRLGLPIDPTARIADLSVGRQQRVEILKALYRDVNVLILDEPTAVLTPAETAQLFAAVTQLRSEGKSIVFISHKLGEVKRICDDVTILRRGKKVYEGLAGETTADQLSREMIGHDLVPVRLDRTQRGSAETRPVLDVADLSSGILRNVTLQVRAGEILGIAGVDGNGQQELAEAITGLRAMASGRIVLSGDDVTQLAPAERFAKGIAHIPNDRKREGLVGPMSVAENIALKRHHAAPFSKGGILAWRSIRGSAAALRERFDIRTPNVDAPVSSLSGGNQQKVILARELALNTPQLVVAMNPVRGLDVAATHFVYEQLLARRAQGGAVLLISSELDELLALCDRIAVLYGGRLTETRFPVETAEQIGRRMTGAAVAV